MDRQRFGGVVAFLGGLYGRELSRLQQEAGWTMLRSLPDEAVEKAIDVIAESGLDRMPPWPLVYRTAAGIANADSALAPQLPAGDLLTDNEHTAAMINLRAKETPEQRRRADRITGESKGRPMHRRLAIAKELLTGPNSKLDWESWDSVADALLSPTQAPALDSPQEAAR